MPLPEKKIANLPSLRVVDSLERRLQRLASHWDRPLSYVMRMFLEQGCNHAEQVLNVAPDSQFGDEIRAVHGHAVQRTNYGE